MNSTPDSSPNPSHSSEETLESTASKVEATIESTASYLTQSCRWLAGRPISWAGLVVTVLSVVTLFRFWYANQLGLVADEAYYWLWSDNLDMCYYSKGPGVAWTIAAGTALFGDTVTGIRFFAVLLAAGTGYWLFRFGRTLFDARTGAVAVGLALVIPLFSVGSTLMTIDPLSLFFWTLAAVAFWNVRESDRAALWIWPGLWIGLGMLCKYTNIAQLISFALFCVWCAPLRRHFRQPTFWTMVGVSLLSLTPTFIWNSKHGWVTVQHLLERGKLDGGEPFRFRLGELIQFISEQALVVSPLLWVLLIASAVAVGRSLLRPKISKRTESVNPAAEPDRWRYLLCLFVPLLVFYLLISVNEAGEANWTAPSFIGGLVLLAAWLLHCTRPGGGVRRFACVAVALAVVQTVAFHCTEFIPLHRLGIKDPIDRTRGHRELGETVANLQQERGAAFLIARSYQTAALIAFYHPNRPHVYLPESPRVENQFSFWPGYSEFMTNEFSALFIARDEGEPRPSLLEEFSDVRLIKEFHTTHRGRPVQKYRVYFCENYLGPPGTHTNGH